MQRGPADKLAGEFHTRGVRRNADADSNVDGNTGNDPDGYSNRHGNSDSNCDGNTGNGDTDGNCGLHSGDLHHNYWYWHDNCRWYRHRQPLR